MSFAVLVKDASNIAKLTRNAYGTGPYEGKSFCTPCSNQDDNLFEGEPSDVLDYISRSELGGARHKYHFETAVVAWSRVEVEETSELDWR